MLMVGCLLLLAVDMFNSTWCYCYFYVFFLLGLPLCENQCSNAKKICLQCWIVCKTSPVMMVGICRILAAVWIVFKNQPQVLSELLVPTDQDCFEYHSICTHVEWLGFSCGEIIFIALFYNVSSFCATRNEFIRFIQFHETK